MEGKISANAVRKFCFKQKIGPGGMVHVVKHLPKKNKSLSTNPVPPKHMANCPQILNSSNCRVRKSQLGTQ
jgi:hypothetical protein